MKIAENFKDQAEKLGILEWRLFSCSMCHTPIGFMFQVQGNPDVVYDSNCDCVTFTSPLQPRSWENVAKLYNMQENSEFIAEMDKFWRWDEENIKIETS